MPETRNDKIDAELQLDADRQVGITRPSTHPQTIGPAVKAWIAAQVAQSPDMTPEQVATVVRILRGAK